ncbi:MAG: hypothetical protein WC809_11865 [Sinimarinibacterium sp.]|jgi:hypothetical protein
MRAPILIKSLVVGLMVVGLAGCFRATPYQPKDRGYGYSEQKLESNRYRVTFSGNSITARETVENYLLYRAAELTLENGYDFFVMVSQETGADTRYRQTISGFYGLGYYYWYPYSSVAVSTSDPETTYEAQAYIVMSKGAKPEGETKAFDARELKANLEANITRPQPKTP